MNRSNILKLSAIAALGLALLPGSAVSQQKPLKEQLVGSWAIVSNDNVAPDGTKRQLFGPNPRGIMILDANGRYALITVNPARPKFKGKTRLDGTPEENKAAIAGTVASFGTWSVDEATSTLITRVEGNLFPNDEGQEQRRLVTLAGDELKQVNLNPGSGGRAEIVFRRTK
jgi:lipocalin-like protein